MENSIEVPLKIGISPSLYDLLHSVWNSLCPFMLLLLSRFSRVRLCATPQTAAHEASPSLGPSRQEHWSGLPFPSPMHESEKWKWSRSVVSYSLRPHGLQPTRVLHPWDFPGKSTGVGCHLALFHTPLYTWNLKRNYTNGLRYKTETDSQPLRMRLGLLGKRKREGTVREFGNNVYRLLFYNW